MLNYLVTPALAFICVFLFVFVISKMFSLLSFKGGVSGAGDKTPYACGEKNYDPMLQPNYSEFFPFAFFFTIAHVAVLMIATVVMGHRSVLILALLYIIAVVVGLRVLLRED